MNRKHGRVTAAFGGSAMMYKSFMDKGPRMEDFDVTYRYGNRFTFMGRGFMDYEFDDEADLSWYIDR